MEQHVTENLKTILQLLEETKKQIAVGISNDVMKGIYTISEENQKLIRLVSETEDNFKTVLAGSNENEVSTTKNVQTVVEEEPVKKNDIPVTVQPTPQVKESVKVPVINVEQPTNQKEPEEILNEDYNEIGEFEENTKTDITQPEEDFTAGQAVKEEKKELSSDLLEDDGLGFSFEKIASEYETNTKKEPEVKEPVQKEEEDVSRADSIDSLIQDINHPKEQKKAAEIIGMPLPQKQELPFYGEVPNEKRMQKDDFIFNQYRIMATHFNSSSASDIMLYVAPLQVLPGNQNVPIIVHAYAHKRFVTASSYDTKNDGHTIVSIEIDDFYLLVRGGFDENGVFSSYVMTTGVSANQGDSLNIVSKEQGYTGFNPVGSGHLKFEEGEYIYELFPLNLEENEYLCITISKEFIDYYVVANDYGSPKIRIHSNGTKKEIIAGWSGDYFEADIL